MIVRITFGRNHFTIGPTFSLSISPGYKMDLPTCIELGEMFAFGRSYGLGLSQSWVVGLQFINFVFVLKPSLIAG